MLQKVWTFIQVVCKRITFLSVNTLVMTLIVEQLMYYFKIVSSISPALSGRNATIGTDTYLTSVGQSNDISLLK